MIAMLIMTLKLAVGTLILAIGMGSTLSDLMYLWRRPGLLLRSLVAMYVLVPLVAFVLVKALPLPGSVHAALLVLAVSAGAHRARYRLRDPTHRHYGPRGNGFPRSKNHGADRGIHHRLGVGFNPASAMASPQGRRCGPSRVICGVSGSVHDRWSRTALACRRSSVSKPSVNQL